VVRLGIPDFETLPECRTRQTAMIARLKAHGYECHQLAFCESDECPGSSCVDACHFAALNRRLKEIPSGYELLAAQDGPVVDISLVHPHWQQEIGALHSFNIPAARQWLYRHLRELPDLIAIGSFEACINTELDGAQHWALGVHAIAAGATRPALRKALALRATPALPKGSTPLVLGDIGNLGRQLAYALKHFVEERRAYANPGNGRVQRRHLPPTPTLWAEHDAWLASLPSGARTVAIGCERRHGRFHSIRR
jgi:hypothetical protein